MVERYVVSAVLSLLFCVLWQCSACIMCVADVLTLSHAYFLGIIRISGREMPRPPPQQYNTVPGRGGGGGGGGRGGGGSEWNRGAFVFNNSSTC